jgi:hypothetical protein
MLLFSNFNKNVYLPLNSTIQFTMKKKSFIGLLFFILFQSSFAQNPELFKDIAPFPFGSKPGSFAVLGSKLIFAANNYIKFNK